MRRLLALAGLFATIAAAHIGSPDIYLDGSAGPYRLFVTVRTPAVIPGVAELEVRAAKSDVRSLRAVPIPLSELGAKFAPVPDKLTQSPSDRQLFTGSLWMMAPGSWQVKLSAEGAHGPGTLAIPVPAAALATERMQPGLGVLLSLLGLFLVAALIATVGAAIREARLPPNVEPDRRRRWAGYRGMAITAAIITLALWGANRWWNSEAASYGEEVYKPLGMTADVNAAQTLTLRLNDPGWLSGPEWQLLFRRTADDFIPDHGHLMHLYVLRRPGLDLVYHLHPALTGPGLFSMKLPSMPRGDYRLYADVVHANGFPETLVSTLGLPVAVNGRPLGPDEATGAASPWQEASGSTRAFALPDSYRMVWDAPPGAIKSRQPAALRFRLLKPDGSEPRDMGLYMGMLGHAAFIKTDGTVFAHVHPSGTVPMAALMLAEKSANSGSEMPPVNDASSSDVPQMTMPGMRHASPVGAGLPNAVSFPYGFPSPGRYRIVVQMKHGQTVETGIFDADVSQ